MLQGVKHIYYRGSLKSCNYRCGYCPFSKNPTTQKELAKDEENLLRFVGWIEKQTEPISIMFTPYGETLIHPYFQQQLVKLSKLPNITAVSCQTNLSVSAERLLETLTEQGADLTKINLWCTLHPTIASTEKFVEKINTLHKHIGLCVGVVGTPEIIDELQALRAAIPSPVYLWVNAMDGMGRRYTAEEVEKIKAVDPLFSLEINSLKANTAHCVGGKESLFISSKGSIYACNISKAPIGNIYDREPFVEQVCKTRACSCFLAYVNRTDIPDLEAFGNQRFIRIPAGLPVDALFIDIDGTLTNTSGTIDSSTINAVKQLATHKRIFLATALPYAHALRKCKEIRPYLSGGVFANGADIRAFDSCFRETIGIPSFSLPKEKGVKTLPYRNRENTYKLAITGNSANVSSYYNKHKEYISKHCSILLEDDIISITHKKASKLNGILQLCSQLSIPTSKVMTVGNSHNDIPMLRHFKYSAAVPSAPEEVKKSAHYIMSINQLVYLCSCHLGISC